MRAIGILVTLAAILLHTQCTAPANQGPVSAGVFSVGPNVQVSHQFPGLGHFENLAAGDPDHPGRLLICSTVAHEDLAGQGYHCYASFDNGQSWSTVLEFDKGPRNSDPALTYGRGDTAFVVNLYIPHPGTGNLPSPTAERNATEVYRSADGGKTWERSAVFPFIDRQAVVVDETGGRYAGRVYITGVSKGYNFPGGPASVLVYRSLDGGNRFTQSAERLTVEGDGLLGASTSVVLSNGTLAFTTFLVKRGRSLNVFDEANPRSGNAQLQLLTSSDGGASLNLWVTVSDVYLSSSGAQFAQLAADPGSPFFKDRLYVVWPDAAAGRINIRFSYSADLGKTWSAPITVNDDRPPLDLTRGPDHLLPAVAVNRDGVVLVTWYDRRESGDNMGWRLWTAASLDGGLTFTPNMPVSEAAHQITAQAAWVQGAPNVSGGATPRLGAVRGRPIGARMSVNSWLLSGGDTDGIAVGADGVFHAVWVDNRTGVPQLWTTPVTVRGTVERHGASELAELEDVTDKVTLETRSTTYDRATGRLTLTAALRNMSRDTIRAPVKARVIALRSQLGVPAVVGAENGLSAVGAVLDLGGTLPPAGLLPDSSATPHTLTFRLSEVRPLMRTRSGGFPSGLVDFDIRVFARQRP